jgi:hypothetical protein
MSGYRQLKIRGFENARQRWNPVVMIADLAGLFVTLICFHAAAFFADEQMSRSLAGGWIEGRERV